MCVEENFWPEINMADSDVCNEINNYATLFTAYNYQEKVNNNQ